MTTFLRATIDHLLFCAEAGKAPEEIARAVLPKGAPVTTWGQALDVLLSAGAAGFEKNNFKINDGAEFRSIRKRDHLRVVGGDK